MPFFLVLGWMWIESYFFKQRSVIGINSLEDSSVQSLDRLGCWGWGVGRVQFSPLIEWVVGGGVWGDMKDDSVEILFQSFLQEGLLSSSGMGRDVHSGMGWNVHSLMMSIQHFLWMDNTKEHPPRCPEWCFREAVVACDVPEPCKFFVKKQKHTQKTQYSKTTLTLTLCTLVSTQ